MDTLSTNLQPREKSSGDLSKVIEKKNRNMLANGRVPSSFTASAGRVMANLASVGHMVF